MNRHGVAAYNSDGDLSRPWRRLSIPSKSTGNREQKPAMCGLFVFSDYCT